MTSTEGLTKGTFVCVEGLKSKKGLEVNGQYGITVGKPQEKEGATRLAIFLFAKSNEDREGGIEGNSKSEAVVLNKPSTMLIKVENLRQLANDEMEAKEVGKVFRNAALTLVEHVRLEKTDEATSMHFFLMEKCIEMFQHDAASSVDIEASFILASLKIYSKIATKTPKARSKDATRALEVIDPVVPLVFEGKAVASAINASNLAMALQLSGMLFDAAECLLDETAGDTKYKYFQQAYECTEYFCENLTPADGDYEVRRQNATGALKDFAGRVERYLSIRPQGDKAVAALAVKATKKAFASNPSPDNVVGMGNMYFLFAKDYVKAAQWFRKALTLPKDECDAILQEDSTAFWTHHIILAQLQLPGMPMHETRIVNVLDGPGPLGHPQTFLCSKIEGDEFLPAGPNGMMFMMSREPPFEYTIPTTDINDPDVFPPHILKMVQPELLDRDESDL